MTHKKGASPALRLTLPGAPEEPHLVRSPDTTEPLPGFYHPTIPVPVGGPGEVTERTAVAWSNDPRIPLEVVDVAAAEADRWREWWRAARRELRAGIAAPHEED